MRRRAIPLLALAVGCASVAAADQTALTTSYAANAELCGKFLRMYETFTKCPLREDRCFTFEWNDESSVGVAKVPFRELAVNQYGYTSISVAEPGLGDYFLLYLNGFQGDRHPRLVETWKVDRKQLRELALREPHPLPYEQWVKGGHGIERNTHASEFADILNRGARINADSEPVWAPIFEAQGQTYAVTRECAGTWRFGGYYDCARIIKLTVKYLSEGNSLAPMCQYVRRRGGSAQP
jgi:hypothetical protein